MKNYLAILALILSIGANIPYIFDIVKGKAKPERISWLLWTLLGLTYYFSAVFSDGATFFTFGELIGPGAIFALSIKYGVGGKSRFDLVSLSVALIAFTMLFIFDGVLTGLILALLVDGIGAMLTIRKLVVDPTSESRSFWLISCFAALFALMSLDSYNLETALFPVYVVMFSIVILILASSSKSLSSKNLKKL
jgi:hypothetical protein